MKTKFFLFFIVLLAISTKNSNAVLMGFGTGSTGNVTYSSGTHYMDNVKSGIVSMSYTSIQLTSATGFAAGDAILVINPVYGQHAYARVASRVSNTLNITTSFPAIFPTSYTQVIKLYEFDTLTVSGSAVLTCEPFDSTTGLGGVVSFLVKNDFYMSGGVIDVRGKGFQGGVAGTIGFGGTGGPGGVNGGFGIGSSAGKFGAGYGGREGSVGTLGPLASIPSFPGSGAPSSNTSTSGTLVFGGGGSGNIGGRGGRGSAGSGGIVCFPGADGVTSGNGGNGGNGGSGGGLIVLKAANVFGLATIFDLRGGNGNIGGNGEDGSVGADGICGGGGGNGGGGGAGGNGGNAGAGGKMRIITLGTVPAFSQLNFIGGNGGSGGIGGDGGDGGLSSNDICACAGDPPPPGTTGLCGNKCNMQKVLNYLDSTTTIVAPGEYTNGTDLNCTFNGPFYDETLGVEYVVGTCLKGGCLYLGYIEYDLSFINAIEHLLLDDATTTIGSTQFDAPEGFYLYLPCDINGASGPGGPDGLDGFNGGDGFFEHDSEPLAVALNSFIVSCERNSAIINWETKSEQNNKHFSIYKSSDGKNREKVTEILGSGNSITPLRYSWTDPNYQSSKPYYFLAQTDFDNTQNWMGMGVADCFEVLSSDISSGYVSESKSIYIRFKDFQKNTQVAWSLYSVTGTKVISGVILPNQNNTHFIENIVYPKGIYFLQVNTSLSSEIHRIVIQ